MVDQVPGEGPGVRLGRVVVHLRSSVCFRSPLQYPQTSTFGGPTVRLSPTSLGVVGGSPRITSFLIESLTQKPLPRYPFTQNFLSKVRFSSHSRRRSYCQTTPCLLRTVTTGRPFLPRLPSDPPWTEHQKVFTQLLIVV